MSNPSAAPISNTSFLKREPLLQNTGISCDILTLSMLNSEIRQK